MKSRIIILITITLSLLTACSQGTSNTTINDQENSNGDQVEDVVVPATDIPATDVPATVMPTDPYATLEILEITKIDELTYKITFNYEVFNYDFDEPMSELSFGFGPIDDSLCPDTTIYSTTIDDSPGLSGEYEVDLTAEGSTCEIELNQFLVYFIDNRIGEWGESFLSYEISEIAAYEFNLSFTP